MDAQEKTTISRNDFLRRAAVVGLGVAGVGALSGCSAADDASASQDLTALETRLKTLEDIDEITKLRAIYANYLDGGWDRAPHTYASKLADLFVEDGVWDGGMGPDAVLRGREAIRTGLEGMKQPSFLFAMHMVLNPLIEVDGDTATGNYHAIVPLGQSDDTGATQATWLFGIYDDVYVRTPEGWRWKSLKFTPAAWAPYATGWTEVEFYKG